MEIFSIASSLVQRPIQDLTQFFFFYVMKKIYMHLQHQRHWKRQTNVQEWCSSPNTNTQFWSQIKSKTRAWFPSWHLKLPHAPSSLLRLKRKNISKLLLSTFRTPSSKLHIPSSRLQSSPFCAPAIFIDFPILNLIIMLLVPFMMRVDAKICENNNNNNNNNRVLGHTMILGQGTGNSIILIFFSSFLVNSPLSRLI